MKLFSLHKKDLPQDVDPWWEKGDCYLGFFIRAENEEEARKMAYVHQQGQTDVPSGVWIDENYTDCVDMEKLH